jgi:hypothetical protein
MWQSSWVRRSWETSGRRSRIVRQSAYPVKRRKPGIRKNHGAMTTRTRSIETGVE